MTFCFICILLIYHAAMIALRRPQNNSPNKAKSDKTSSEVSDPVSNSNEENQIIDLNNNNVNDKGEAVDQQGPG